MKYEIAKYDFEGHEIPTLINNETGDPWWIAKDVCGVLGYARANDAVTAHCKCPKILKHGETPYLEIPPRGMYIIPESDLYRLIIKSHLPGAERFERWVMEEVLPSIRKHGAYVTPSTLDKMLSSPEGTIAILERLKAEQERNRMLQGCVDQFENTEGLLNFTQAAKMLGTSATKLTDALRKAGALFKTKKNGQYTNLPIQKFVDAGWFVVKNSVNIHTGWTGTQTATSVLFNR